MADSVRTRIRKAAATLVRTVRKSSNYLTDVAEVNTEDVDLGNMKNFPCVNIVLGTERVLKRAESRGAIDKVLPISLDAYFVAPKNAQDIVDNFIQDMEKLFLASATGYSISGTCRELMFSSNAPVYLTVNKPNVAVTIELEVYYSQSITDPTTLL